MTTTMSDVIAAQADEIIALRAEAERLKAERDRAQARCLELARRAGALQSEVERLRSPDLRIVYGYEAGAADLNAAEARAETAEAEVERLREGMARQGHMEGVPCHHLYSRCFRTDDDLREYRVRQREHGAREAAARAEKAEAAIARVRALADEMDAIVEPYYESLSTARVRAALEEES